MTAIQADQPYDVYARLEDPMGVLSIALGQWGSATTPGRSLTSARPRTRLWTPSTRCAELHAMRARLVGEIRAGDDATAARADAMLAAAREPASS